MHKQNVDGDGTKTPSNTFTAMRYFDLMTALTAVTEIVRDQSLNSIQCHVLFPTERIFKFPL